MAKGNKSSSNNMNNSPDNPKAEDEVQNAQPSKGDAGQMSSASYETGQLAPESEPQAESEALSEPDAAPFLFESGGVSAAAHDQSHGQFDAEEMEFESWMFDAGEGRGIVMPDSLPQAQAADSAPPISGKEIPTPDFVNAFVQDQGVPESPIDAIYGSAQDSSLDVRKILSGIEDPGPIAPAVQYAAEHYPASPEAWDDQMLSSVDDFSAVLLALQANVSAPHVPVAPVEEHPAGFASAAPQETSEQEVPNEEEAWPQWLDQLEAAQPETASHVEPAIESPAEVAQAQPEQPAYEEQAEVVQPPWQLGDMQDTSVAMPVEVAHTPEAYMGEAVAEPDFSALEQAVAPAEEPSMAPPAQPQPDFSALTGQPAEAEPSWETPSPDFGWLEQEAPALEAQAAQPLEYTPIAEEAAPAPVAEYREPAAAEVLYTPEQPIAEEATPEWSAVMEESLPPWLAEAAATGMEISPETASSYPEPSYDQFEGYNVEAVGAYTEPEAAPQMVAPQETAPVGYEQQAVEMPGFEAWQGLDEQAQPFQPLVESEQGSAAPEAAPEGQFSGAEMEFETWMFDQGKSAPLPSLPGMSAMMPSVQAMEGAVAWQSPAPQIEADLDAGSRTLGAQEASEVEMSAVEPADEELPFWLQDRSSGEAQGAGGMPALSVEGFPPVATLSDTSSPTSSVAVQEPPVEEAAKPAPEPTFDFAELPPIEPFDFSMLQPVQEEEELGFSTEELTSVQPQDHEPMMVTANLDVLADLLGKERIPGLPDKNLAPDLESITVSHLLPPQRPPAPEPVQDAAPVQPELASAPAPTPVPAVPESEPKPEPVDTEKHLGWTATATSKLAPETVSNLTTGPTQGIADTSSTIDRHDALTTVSELNVSPFDISELDLEAEETATEFLTGSMASHPVAQSPAKILTGTLFTPSGAQGPDYWEAPAWMADVVEDQAPADRNTSRFPAARAEEVEDEAGSTQFLAGRAAREPETAEVDASAVFKARVSRFRVPEEPARDAPVHAAAAQAHEVSPVQPAPTGEDSVHQAPPVLSPSMTSGPLGKVTGFDDLEQMVAARPGEVGTHMALAVAYAQAGHTEHALNEYKRILNNRKVPPPMLQIISDQLDEMESEADGFARFHQLRGDLYMKQGRFEEAIEEYNKIQ